jgi:hypothetical protein
MYNLLVTAGEGSWNEPVYTFGVGRFLEHTSDALKARFGGLDAEAIAALEQAPDPVRLRIGRRRIGARGPDH